MNALLRPRAFLPALVLLAACGSEPPPPPVLAGGATSLPALGQLALTAFARGDTLTLHRLRLSEEEHNTRVWPELPAAQGFPVDLAWSNIETRNRRALGRNLDWFRERVVEFADVRCDGETRRFASFSVRTDCWVRFRVDGDGQAEAQLFEEALEWRGTWKVFRWADEEGVKVLER